MTPETAMALFVKMPPERKTLVLAVFAGIIGAFPNVRDAFTQAVADECLVIETERLLQQLDRSNLQ